MAAPVAAATFAGHLRPLSPAYGETVILLEGPGEFAPVTLARGGKLENRFGAFPHAAFVGMPYGAKVRELAGGVRRRRQTAQRQTARRGVRLQAACAARWRGGNKGARARRSHVQRGALGRPPPSGASRSCRTLPPSLASAHPARARAHQPPHRRSSPRAATAASCTCCPSRPSCGRTR